MRCFTLATLVSLSLAGLAGVGVAQEPVTQSTVIDQSVKAQALFKKGCDAADNHNDNEAIKYFQKAAELGHTEAQARLGALYLIGNNPEKSIVWLTKAASAGLREAQYNLGLAYLHGKGVKKNPIEAAKWLKKASDLELVSAQIAMANLYAKGIGVKQDLEESAKLVDKLASNNDPETLVMAGAFMFKNQNYQATVTLLEKAAKLGSAEAQFYLSSLYSEGVGVTKDLKKAKQLMTQSAESGYAMAQFGLYLYYQSEIEGEQNTEKALSWLEKAVNQDYLKAQLAYAVHLTESQQHHQAFQVLQKAVKNQSDEEEVAIAQLMLGAHYLDGLGTRQNFSEGFKWIQKAAHSGLSMAQQMLGSLYELGKGTKQNLKVAKSWYGKACDNGYQDGCDSYRRLNERGI